MSQLHFVKMHGLGNDYVYVDCFDGGVRRPQELAARLSARRTGIGADGLILICPSDAADGRMEMYNADGSRGKMCGNGIRCVGKYLYESGRARRNPLRVDSDAGVKVLELHLRDDRVESVTVDMGEPVLDGPRIPVTAEGQVIDAPLRVGEREWRITCVSMGNPHCVVFVDGVAALDLERLGPQFERHPFFPERVNTEFVEVAGARELTMRVWERGSGETAACGTGACAVLVAAVLNGRADPRATVHLNGGDLEIDWRQRDGRVFMTGPAVESFRGTIEV
jgi:diaminopimelate epimerase